MEIKSTSYFDKQLLKYLNKNPQLKKRVSKQLKLLTNNISHPSLRTHKLQGKRHHSYSIWIENNLRIIFSLIENKILLTSIITHDKY